MRCWWRAEAAAAATTPRRLPWWARVATPTAIALGQTSQCTATVSGTGSFSSTVSWTASGGGTITPASGLFTASTVPFTTQVTITATSTQDTTKSGSTTITVAAAGTVTSVTATCSPSSVQTGQLSTCTATVNGTGNFSPNVDLVSQRGNDQPDHRPVQQFERGDVHHYSHLAAGLRRRRARRRSPWSRESTTQLAHYGGWRARPVQLRQRRVCHRDGLHAGNIDLPDHRSCAGRYRLDRSAAAGQRSGRRRT